MRKIQFSLSLFMLFSFLISCSFGAKSKDDKGIDAQTPENTLDWQGTYDGVFPAADASGQYILLAIDSNSYAKASKFIDRPGVYVSKGKIEWNSAGDSLTLVGDYQKFKVYDGNLIEGPFELTKISDELKLPHLLISQTLKDDKTGVNAVLEQYSEDGKEYAKFYFGDKTYELKREDRNTQRIEYTSDKVRLYMQELNTDTIQWDIHPLLIDDKDTCRFTVLSPVNDIYVATGKPQIVNSFDVLYLNGEEGSEVMLLSSFYKYCFTLPQQTASAKTAEYYSNNIMWASGLNDATLTLGDQSYQFKEQTPLTTNTAKKASHTTNKSK